MESIANEETVCRLGETFAAEIPKRVDPASKSNRDWTIAVHAVLKEYAQTENWKIYPEERPYKGEYLCDFMLFEDGYGCRIACESQWYFRIGDNNAKVDWAFDKLRGVKADIKLFVFEGADLEWRGICEGYLEENAQLSVKEAFLILYWKDGDFIKSWWQPQCDGRQNGKICFVDF
jgi:hypothetical protein